jgi:outer membrane protein OmpA-like peptidoglycan-associated protein
MNRTALICLLAASGCTREAKPVELVAYEHRTREAYRPTLEVRQPELLTQSRAAHREAVKAWRRKDADAAIHYTRLADIYWRTAEALSHTKDLNDATVAFTRQAAQHAQSRALADERLAAAARDIHRLERLKVLRSELVKVKRTARQEKRATAARQQIDRAMNALQAAEGLAAERHAIGPLNKARQSLQNAFEAFNAGRYAEASTAADLAQADAAAAAELARPLYEAEAEQRALDAELRKMLEEIAGAPWADARVEQRGLVVSLRELFAPNKAKLSQSIRVQPVARLALAHERFPLLIEGHTDNRGVRADNATLSKARAQAVAQVLTAAGVPQTRITVAGKGDSQPIAENGSTRGRALNRRVEVVFLRPEIKRPAAP